MQLVALVQPSSGTHPGHMVIGQEADDGAAQFFGYRFDPAALPVEYQAQDQWQEFLSAHKVPGNIHDERKYVRDLREDAKAVVCELRVSCAGLIKDKIPPRKHWRHFASYSFRPDDFHSEAEPCYNCVTWAIKIGNSLVESFLTPVRQGRIKLIVRQIQARADNAGGTGG